MLLLDYSLSAQKKQYAEHSSENILTKYRYFPRFIRKKYRKKRLTEVSL